MNLRMQRLMKLHRLHDQAGEHGSDTGGTGTGNAGAAAAGEGAAAAGAGEGNEGQAAASKADEGKASDEGKSAQPSDAEAKLLKDLMKHKNRAKELESELSQVKETLKQFEGIDAAKVRQMMQEQEDAERKRLEARGEYDRLVKQMGERHQEEKTRLEQRIAELQGAAGTLERQIAELTVGNAFGSSRFVADELTLTPAKARVIYGQHFEFKDGAIVAYDKPAGAPERTLLVDSTGEPLSFDEALRKLVEADPDRDQLIRAKAKPGAGSATIVKGAQQAVSKVEAAKKAASLSPAEKIAAGLKALATTK